MFATTLLERLNALSRWSERLGGTYGSTTGNTLPRRTNCGSDID
jgi:hypothetical protein